MIPRNVIPEFVNAPHAVTKKVASRKAVCSHPNAGSCSVSSTPIGLLVMQPFASSSILSHEVTAHPQCMIDGALECNPVRRGGGEE